jgi:formiminoglutamate deiminase
MAGMTEYRAQDRESFWTWRTLMYRFLDHLSPDHIAAIAALTFMEMQKAGYAAVGEFHYVHHQPGGQAYDNPAELSLQAQPLTGGQLRFGNSVDAFSDIVARSHSAMAALPSDTRIGIAPHSLRATSQPDMRKALDLHAGMPVHMHIAEQTKEVEEVFAMRGARPVEWVLGQCEVNEKWCLIHATHMTEDETAALAKSGAVAGLCPITEANLGDGIFNGANYVAHGGTFGIGSDSNVNISLTEELRTLEYSQRLRDRQRNVMVAAAGSVGEALYFGAARGGAQALDRDAGRIEVGALADLVAIDTTDPAICALSDQQLLDGVVFAAKDTVVSDLWSAGRHQVRDRRHVAEDKIISGYRKAITDLRRRLG